MRKALVGAEHSLVCLDSREREMREGRGKRKGSKGKVEREGREVTCRNYYFD